jgi:hypothetical protein
MSKRRVTESPGRAHQRESVGPRGISGSDCGHITRRGKLLCARIAGGFTILAVQYGKSGVGKGPAAFTAGPVVSGPQGIQQGFTVHFQFQYTPMSSRRSTRRFVPPTVRFSLSTLPVNTLNSGVVEPG